MNVAPILFNQNQPMNKTCRTSFKSGQTQLMFLDSISGLRGLTKSDAQVGMRKFLKMFGFPEQAGTPTSFAFLDENGTKVIFQAQEGKITYIEEGKKDYGGHFITSLFCDKDQNRFTLQTDTILPEGKKIRGAHDIIATDKGMEVVEGSRTFSHIG